MDEQMMNRVMMIAGAAMTVISAIVALGLVIWSVISSLWILIPAVLVAVFAVLCAMATSYYTEKIGGKRNKVLSTVMEQEVLTRKQQAQLRAARGEVVMERALAEVENERDNIAHRAIQASHDEAKPPHKTRFGELN
jgi:membrane protein implicated in regulation of membrane protease activity